MRSFKVLDSLFSGEETFRSETQADAYILQKRNEILSEKCRDEPSSYWKFKEVICPAERTEYHLMENDETYGIFLVKWPTY